VQIKPIIAQISRGMIKTDNFKKEKSKMPVIKAIRSRKKGVCKRKLFTFTRP
jgi:hypothetical protein